MFYNRYIIIKQEHLFVSTKGGNMMGDAIYTEQLPMGMRLEVDGKIIIGIQKDETNIESDCKQAG